MKSGFAICLISIFVRIGIYAQNLVPNPSFENVNCSGLTTGLGQISAVIPWVSPTLDQVAYYNSCIPDLNTKTPKNIVGFQYPRTGNAFVGIVPFNITWVDQREYIQIKLDTFLNPCKDYKIEFYVSLADKYTIGVSAIGAYLSNTAISSNDYLFLPYKPQVYSDPLNPIMDTANWVKISGFYNAKGGERYLTIGNFNDDLRTKIDSIPPYRPIYGVGSYYYLDDVSVIEQINVRKANAGNDASICKGASVKIGTVLDTAGIKVNWQPMSGLSSNTIQQPMATPLTTTTYTLTLTYNCGNTSSDTVTVFVNNPVAIITTAKTNLCPGETGTATVTVNNAIGPYTFNWSGGVSGSGFQVSGLVAGSYSVTVTDALGCTATTGVTFININAPIASISTAQTTITEGEQVTLNGSGGVSYLWSPASLLSCYTCPNPTTKPDSTTTYRLIVTNTNGCTDTANITVTVTIADEQCFTEKDIFIPTAFSPNNDGNNDVLHIRGSGLKNIYWGIYDRWGTLVFEAYNQTHPWDGTKKGNPVEAGVYVYYLRGTCSKTNSAVSLKGNITLIK